MSIQRKLHTLFISLESLDLNITDNINRVNNYNSYILPKYYTRKKMDYCLQEVLDIFNAINGILLNKALQEKIRAILLDYSYFYPMNTKMFSITTKKYINRFIYKYQMFYKDDSTKKMYTQHEKINRLLNKSIIHLYLCNKIIAHEGPYLLYQYIYGNTYNINLNLSSF